MMNIPLPKLEEGYCAGLGAAAIAMTQWAAKKPVNSAYPKYAIGIAMGFGVGHFIHKFKVQRIAEREAYIFDYVNKHPEDFPEIMDANYKKATYGDIMQTWSPIRGAN